MRASEMSARTSEIQMSQPQHLHSGKALARSRPLTNGHFVPDYTSALSKAPNGPEERSAYLCGDIPSKAASGVTKHLQLMATCS